MTETIKVQGMGCQGCVNTVKNSVSELKGVSVVDVDLDSGSVDVTFDDQTSIQEIKDTIEEQGYDVVQ